MTRRAAPPLGHRRDATRAGGTVRSRAATGGSVAFTWRGERDERRARRRRPLHASRSALWTRPATRPGARSTSIVDTTGPVDLAGARRGAFSPNGDGAQDTTRLSWTANERGSGTVRLYAGSTVVRSWAVTGVAGWAATWDGRRAGGQRVGDGTYTLRVDLVDAGGNRRVASTTVVVDRTAGFLRWARDFYPQDGDALAPTSTLSWQLARDAKTTLRLYDASGRRRPDRRGRGRSHGDGARASGRGTAGARTARSRPRAGTWPADASRRRSGTTLVVSRWSGRARSPSRRRPTTVKAGQTLTVRVPLGRSRSSTKPRVTFKQPGRAAVTRDGDAARRRLVDGVVHGARRRDRRGTIRVTATDRRRPEREHDDGARQVPRPRRWSCDRARRHPATLGRPMSDGPTTRHATRPPALGRGRLGRPADLQRGREPARDRGGDPRGAARRHAARRRRQLARRDRRARRRSSRPTTRGSACGIAPGKQGLGSAYLDGFGVALAGGATIVVQMDADWSHDPTALPAPHRARSTTAKPRTSSSARATPRAAASRTGASSAGSSRAAARLFAQDRPQPQPQRPHRRVQGLARLDPRARAVRRRPRRRLRVPDRDDVPRLAPRRPGRRGADHVPRPARRPVQDEPPDRRRGAVRRDRACAGTSSAAAGRCPAGDSDRRRPPTGWRPGARGRRRRRRSRVRAERPARARAASASSSTSARSRTPSARPLTADLPRAAARRAGRRAARRRVVLVPPRAPTRTTRPRAGRTSRSSAAACCRRPGCSGPAP